MRIVTPQGELSVSFEYSTELFDEARIAAFTDHFERLMTALLADPGRCAGDVDLLTDRERHDHLVTWNDTSADHGTADPCLHDLVTGAADTFSVALPDLPADEAVTTALPAATPVALPFASTVATAFALDDQLKVTPLIGMPF